MNAYPIGNDLTVKWSLQYSDGSAFPLSLYEYELSYRTSRGTKVVTDTAVVSVEDNILTWSFSGDQQVASGPYSLNLKIALTGSKMIELQYDNAFMLSPLKGLQGAGSEIVLQSVCDAIDLKEAVLQARLAMDKAAQAVSDTSASAQAAEAAKEAAEVTAAQAKTDAEEAKAKATEASEKAVLAEKDAFNASRDAAVAQMAAQTASDHIVSLEQAISQLPDGQAVTEKVAEHTIKLTELELDVDELQSDIVVGDITSITFTKTRGLYPVGGGTMAVISNPDQYTYIALVKQGAVLNITLTFASGFGRYAFTSSYPANGIPITGYGSIGWKRHSIQLVSPQDGFFILATDSEATAISGTTTVIGTIGRDVHDLQQSIVVAENRILSPSTIVNTGVRVDAIHSTPTESVRYVPVKSGQSCKIEIVQTSDDWRLGYTTSVPSIDVVVQGYVAKSHRVTTIDTVSPVDGFLCVSTYNPSFVSIEINTPIVGTIGREVYDLKTQAEEMYAEEEKRSVFDSSFDIRSREIEERFESVSKMIGVLVDTKLSNGDTVSLPLNGNDGGKYILHLHKRANDGFSTVNDVFLPNARNDFGDVRVSANGKSLPYSVVYSGNIDILPDPRLVINGVVYTNSHGQSFSVVGRKVNSTTDGKTWGIIAGLSAIDASVVSFVGADDALFFASADGKLYKSSYPYTTYAMAIDLSERTGNVVTPLSHSMVQLPSGEYFYATYQAEFDTYIFKSVDGGVTWTECLHNTTYQHCHNLQIDTHTNPVAIYAGMDGGGGIFKSTDKGTSWTDLRAQNPSMPQASDYGAIYCGPGFRLIGGETSIVGGASIIKTTDDSTFRVVLANGKAVYFVRELGGKLYAGSISSGDFRDTQLLVSEDDGETWNVIYSTSFHNTSGASDGFRALSKVGDELWAYSQNIGDSVRILSGGNNYYAEIIVEVPEGISELTLETGYACPNIKQLYNDDEGVADVSIPLNEGTDFTMVSIGGVKRYAKTSLNYIETGAHLGNYYPFVVAPKFKYSGVLESGIAFPAKVNLSGNLHIGIWLMNSMDFDVVLLQDVNMSQCLRLINHQLWSKDSLLNTDLFPIVAGTLVRLDLNISADGTVTTYVNGKKGSINSGFIHDGWDGDMEFLKSNTTGNTVQGFKIHTSLKSDEEILSYYYGGLNDNLVG